MIVENVSLIPYTPTSLKVCPPHLQPRNPLRASMTCIQPHVDPWVAHIATECEYGSPQASSFAKADEQDLMDGISHEDSLQGGTKVVQV